MNPRSAIHTARRGVGALVLALLLLAGIAFARPAMADTPVTYYGLSFSWSEGDASPYVSEAGGVVTISAPSGTITISGTSEDEFDQIIVPATNKATIELSGVKIDEFSSNEPRHTTILNGVTNLVVSGTNTIYASDRYSAIWSPVDLTITGKGEHPTLTLYDGSHKNAAISIIARNLTVGTLSAAGPTINGLLLGGTLSGTSTFLTGSLTINSGTINAENEANYQQALSAGTLTINGGKITATMSGTKSNAISATRLIVNDGAVKASATGPSSNAINAGKVTIQNGAGVDDDGPTLELASATSAIGCPVIFMSSTADSTANDFYPWLAQGGDTSENLHVLSFAGAGNAQTAATTGISLGTKYVKIQPAKLEKLAFTPAESSSAPQTNGVQAGDSVKLELEYQFEGFESEPLNFNNAPLTTFFPVTGDAISPSGNATTTYTTGETQGSISFNSGATGRTTSIEPEPWPLLAQVYGSTVNEVIAPLAFPMKYKVTFTLGESATWSGEDVSSLITNKDGNISLTSTPEKSDYTFSYWQDGSTAITSENLSSYVFNKDTTLTAVFAQNAASVTFNANGGAWGSSDTLEMSVGQDAQFDAPATSPTQPGKIFLGWATDKNATAGLVTFPTSVSGATATFYAQWGTPNLSLSTVNETVAPEASVTFTASASTDPTANPAISPEGLTVETNPPCSVSFPVISAGQATFTVTAPKMNGPVEVSASWAGVQATSQFTVTGGVDMGNSFYVTFQGNGGVWDDSIPFKTFELSKKGEVLPSDDATQLTGIKNGELKLLAWYEWIPTDEPTNSVDAPSEGEGNGVTPVYGYWHSVDLATKTFTQSTTLTAMWADTNKKTLVLWPPSQTTKPSVPVTYTAAILPEPLQTGVLPPYNYEPGEGNAITPGNLAISFAENATYGATASTPVAGDPTSVATFTVTAPNATPADSNGVVIQARYPKDASAGGEQLTATATLVVEPNPAPPTPPAPTYTVTLDGNGGLWNGTVPSQKVNVSSGGSVRVPAGLANEGLELLGWYQQGKDGAWQEVDLATWRVTSNATLTAQWAEPSLALTPAVQVAKPGATALFNAALALTPLEEALEPEQGAIIPSQLRVTASSACEVGVPASNGTGVVFSVTAPASERSITLTAAYGEAIGTARLIVTTSAPVAVHRLYNPYDGSHLLSSDTAEILGLTPLGWIDESVKFYVFGVGAEGREPVTRLYNPYNGDHVYSTNPREVDDLTPLGWVDEGVKFYGAAPESATPIYRLWNSKQTANGGLGSHLWTYELEEYETLPTLPPVGAWKQEGTAWYAAYVPEVEEAEATG